MTHEPSAEAQSCTLLSNFFWSHPSWLHDFPSSGACEHSLEVIIIYKVRVHVRDREFGICFLHLYIPVVTPTDANFRWYIARRRTPRRPLLLLLYSGMH